ncbi:unnamed protein product, partial [Polarella glacialis]
CFSAAAFTALGLGAAWSGFGLKLGNRQQHISCVRHRRALPSRSSEGAALELLKDEDEVSEDEFPSATASGRDDQNFSKWQDSLNARQRDAVDAVLRGDNVLITGGAGVGKTFVGNAIREALASKYGDTWKDKVAVTASTGTAALLTSGCTLNAALGIGVPRELKDFAKIRTGNNAEFWKRAEVLVLDEASMISGELLDRLDVELRKLRKVDTAFGGVQVVLIGDLFQLPPISTKLPKEVLTQLDPQELANGRAVLRSAGRKSELFLNRGMIFQSEVFWDLNLEIIELVEPLRQRADSMMWRMLQSLRTIDNPKQVKEAIACLNKECFRPLKLESPKQEVVTLLPTVKQVEEINLKKLKELKTKLRLFKATDSVEAYPIAAQNRSTEELEDILRKMPFFASGSSACPAAGELMLKVGAFVMMTVNLEDSKSGKRIANGATGTVVSYAKNNNVVVVDFDGCKWRIQANQFESIVPGVGVCNRRQFPLRLSWAMTHHRSQGRTLRHVRVDARSFSEGQSYVALSRSTGMDGLELLSPLRLRDFRANAASRVFFEYFAQGDLAGAREELGSWRDMDINGRPRGGVARWAGEPRFSFGKHSGQTFQDVATNEAGYVRWLREQRDTASDNLLEFLDWLDSQSTKSATTTHDVKDTRENSIGSVAASLVEPVESPPDISPVDEESDRSISAGRGQSAKLGCLSRDQLQAMLRERNLPVSGRKSEMISLLLVNSMHDLGPQFGSKPDPRCLSRISIEEPRRHLSEVINPVAAMYK